jgi:hypothetical protein
MESKAHNTKAAIRGKRKRFLEVLMDAEQETVEQLCQKAGISRDSYYRYIKDPKISALINEGTTNSCTARTPFVVRALLKSAETGNIQAIRTVLELKGLVNSGTKQTVNVGVHDNSEPPALQIDTPEQLEQAIAQCQAEMTTLKELIANLVAMRTQPHSRLGDGIHPQPDATTDEEA